MHFRRALVVVLGALPLVLLLSFPAAATGPPALATGSFTQVSFTSSNERVVGGVFMFDFTETDVLTGALVGTSVVEGSCVVRRALYRTRRFWRTREPSRAGNVRRDGSDRHLRPEDHLRPLARGGGGYV